MSENNFKDLLAAGAAGAQHQVISDVPVIVAPEGYNVHELDLESYQPAPKRCHGTVRLETVKSFTDYISRNLTLGQTVVFADMDSGRFTAIFNYHKDGSSPGWGDNRAVLELTPTVSWKRWMEMNERRMDQLAFADFIESNALDIVTPSAAEVMEMVSALKVNKKAAFHSVIDNRTGRQTVEYSEDTKGETTKGNLEFTGQFELALQPYRNRGVDVTPYKVNARLRFDITEQGQNKSALRVHYSLINHALVREYAFGVELDVIDQFLNNLSVPMFDGSPA
jgi:uncharacterized protein YfdQ (DUF2303 family)